MKPEFIDNRNGNTMAAALGAHLDWLAQVYREPVELAIATGYFNPEGFALIAEKLARLPHVRLLLGAEPTPPPVKPIRKPGEPRGERFEAKLVREAIEANFRIGTTWPLPRRRTPHFGRCSSFLSPAESRSAAMSRRSSMARPISSPTTKGLSQGPATLRPPA